MASSFGAGVEGFGGAGEAVFAGGGAGDAGTGDVAEDLSLSFSLSFRSRFSFFFLSGFESATGLTAVDVAGSASLLA